MNLDPMTNQNLKSFWQRPEGKTGMLFIGVGIIAFLKFAPVLLALATNAVAALVMISIFVAMVMALSDKRFRNLISVMFKVIVKNLTGMVIKIDPILILKDYLDKLEKDLIEMDKQIGILKGRMRELKNIIEKNAKEISEKMLLLQEAKKTNNSKVKYLEGNRAARLSSSNADYTKLYNKMEVIYRVLTKMYENLTLVFLDKKDDVKEQETRWKIIRQAYKAMKSAMSVMNGNPDERAMFEQAMEYIASDLGNKLGEMEHFMEVSKTFMDTVDLQNGVYENKALAMLEEWEKKADSYILGDDKTSIVSTANAQKISNIGKEQESYEQVHNDYKKLFD